MKNYSTILFFVLYFFVGNVLVAQSTNISGVMSGDQENPAVTTPATGTITGTIDRTTGVLTINITYSDLKEGLTLAHIHKAPNGVNGDVIFNLNPTTGNTSGTISVSTTLSGDNLIAFLAEGCYVNIHTSAHGGGEIRGQILMTDAEYKGTLTVAESSNPSSGSMGTGSVTGFYDDNNNDLEVYAVYANLLATPNAAHIHPGAAGQSGGPLYGMTAGGSNNDEIGVYSVSQSGITQENEDKLKTDALYVNIHTPSGQGGVPGGEVRTQLEQQDALAIDYQQFQAVAQNNRVTLSWKATDTPQDFFVVEHRQKNSSFSTIGKVIVDEINNSNYIFTTLELTSGIHYFRLQAIDNNGLESVSAVIAVRLATSTEEVVTIFPNPVENEMFLNSNQPLLTGTIVTLFYESGKIIESIVLENSSNQQVIPMPFKIKQLAKGIYFVKVENENLSEVISIVR